MQRILTVVILIFVSIQLYSQETYVFFGSYNWDKNKPGIYAYQLNSKTGKLKKVAEVAGIFNPSFITLAPNGKFLYACTDAKTPAGSVSSFEFNPEKKEIHFLNSVPSEGVNPVYVSVHKSGKWLANANYDDGSLSVFPIKDDGTIGTVNHKVQYQKGSVYPERQERAHVHSSVFSPDGDYVLFPDLGADKIRIYKFNSNVERPFNMIENTVKADPGSGPRHFTFHPNGNFGYSIEELSGEISVYSYASGTLGLVQKIKAHPDNLKEGFESSDVHFSPDGKFLYATNRGKENNIAIFSVQENGTLQNIGYQPTLGNHPRTFAIDPSGNYLIVTNVKSSEAVVFKRNLKTGLLKKIDAVSIENVTCVQMQHFN